MHCIFSILLIDNIIAVGDRRYSILSLNREHHFLKETLPHVKYKPRGIP